MNTLHTEVKEILEDMIEDNYTMQDIINDLNQGGCQSGFINDLIYYSDTEKFYKRHEEEIEDLLIEIGYSRDLVCGDIDFNITTYTNNAAWIAFEVTAQGFDND